MENDNNLLIQEGYHIEIAILGTNYLGVPIENLRIDLEIIESDALFYEGKTTDSCLTESNGELAIRIYPPAKPGTVEVRATIFATGDYTEFILTATESD